MCLGQLRAVLTEEHEDVLCREKEESLRRFQESVRKRVAQQACVRKRQQLQKSSQMVRKAVSLQPWQSQCCFLCQQSKSLLLGLCSTLELELMKSTCCSCPIPEHVQVLSVLSFLRTGTKHITLLGNSQLQPLSYNFASSLMSNHFCFTCSIIHGTRGRVCTNSHIFPG